MLSGRVQPVMFECVRQIKTRSVEGTESVSMDGVGATEVGREPRVSPRHVPDTHQIFPPTNAVVTGCVGRVGCVCASPIEKVLRVQRNDACHVLVSNVQEMEYV